MLSLSFIISKVLAPLRAARARESVSDNSFLRNVRMHRLSRGIVYSFYHFPSPQTLQRCNPGSAMQSVCLCASSLRCSIPSTINFLLTYIANLCILLVPDPARCAHGAKPKPRMRLGKRRSKDTIRAWKEKDQRLIASRS